VQLLSFYNKLNGIHNNPNQYLKTKMDNSSPRSQVKPLLKSSNIMNKEQKAKKLQAKYQALANAAQFIGSHGEEGFSYNDKQLHKYYLKECANISDKLNQLTAKCNVKYHEIGIDVDTSSDF